MSVPVRAAPVLGSIANDTVPGPSPRSPSVTRIHEMRLSALHEQPATAETRTDALPPGAPARVVPESRSKRQGAASCEIPSRCPDTSMVPSRARGAGLAATAKPNDAGPCPEACFGKLIHCVALAALHEHSRAVASVTLPVPPAAPNARVKAVTEIWHLSAVGPARVVAPSPHAPAQAAVRAARRHAARRTGRGERRAAVVFMAGMERSSPLHRRLMHGARRFAFRQVTCG